MARVQINYPAPDPAPAAPAAPAATGPTYYRDPPTKMVPKLSLFGFPIISERQQVYDWNDPAVRALYGLDQPGRNQPPAGQAPAPAPGASGSAQGQPVRTPVSSYGVNDTGRTTPFAPNPTYTNTTTLPMAGPTYPAGSGSPSMQGAGGNPQAGSADPFGGFLGALMGLLTGKKPNQGGDQYEAALRERPKDIQALVSMSQRGGPQGQNAGGFLGGLFDEPKG